MFSWLVNTVLFIAIVIALIAVTNWAAVLLAPVITLFIVIAVAFWVARRQARKGKVPPEHEITRFHNDN